MEQELLTLPEHLSSPLEVIGKYYVVIQSAMHFGNFRALLENIGEIYFFSETF
jgi:hypothetical protein